KAVTFSTVKWPHLAASPAPASGGGDEALEIVRCSVGRIGEEALLQRADDELAALAAGEMAGGGRVGGGGTGGGDRGRGRAGRHPGHPLGRRAAPVHGGAPGPGGRDPCGGDGAAGARRLRRGPHRGRRTRPAGGRSRPPP